MKNSLEKYIEENSAPQEETLAWLERETNIRTGRGRMLSGPVLGSFLELFSGLLSPKYVLEIGTFTGYSAIVLARGLSKGGVVDSIEKNDELEPLIREAFSRAGVGERINLIFGDAVDLIPALQRSYDLVYIDGNKREYGLYYDLVINKVVPGGYILADNVLWDGKVLDCKSARDAQTSEIISFNSKVSADPRVKNFILPIRDGLNIIKKL